MDQTSQVTGRPYSEIEGNGYVVREFSQNTPTFELVWHRDKEDRTISTLHKTDWKFQLENDIPRKLTQTDLFIPKETYHRLIKGTGDLKLKIYKDMDCNCKNCTCNAG